MHIFFTVAFSVCHSIDVWVAHEVQVLDSDNLDVFVTDAVAE
jgi:hypothetical protein